MGMSLRHVWEGCPSYDITPLKEALVEHLPTLCSGSHWTLDFDEWPTPFWYPLICLKALERHLDISRKQARTLNKSRKAREWAIGAYLWHIWKQQMRETAEPGFTFVPWQQVEALRNVLGVG